MNSGIIAILKLGSEPFLYVAVIIVSILAIFGKPKYALFMLIFLLPLQNVVEKLQNFPLGKDLDDVLLIASLIGSFINNSRSGAIAYKSNINILLWMMIGYSFLSLWWGSISLGLPLPINFNDSRLQNWKNYALVLPFLFWAVKRNIHSFKEVRQVFWVVILTIIMMNYYTIDQIKYAGGIESRLKFNGTFSWVGANEVAAFYSFYTLILIGVVLFYRKIKYIIILLPTIFANIYCLFFLYSRGAYISFLIGLSFLFLIKKKILILPILIIMLFWQNMLPAKVVERILQTHDESDQLDKSSLQRLDIWNQGIELFKKSPIVGVGYNTFKTFGYDFKDTHNVFLKFLAEQGIIGISLFILFMLTALARGLYLYFKVNDVFLKGISLGFSACVIAVIIANFFGDRWTYIPLGAYFWVFLGLVEKSISLSKQKQAAKIKSSTRNDKKK